MFVEDLANDELRKTENGANAFNTSGNALVDLNFKVPSMRTHIDYILFEKSLQEDTEHTLKWLLYLRDIRDGIGERKSFREICVYLSNKHEELFLKFLIVHLEEFGRYDDLVYIAYNTKSVGVKRSVITIIINQLEKDVENMNSNKSISLLAKWLPSENSSSKETKKMAKFMMKELSISPKVYRKTLSKLRKYIDVVETHMSNNTWDKIDYESVPSKANLVYGNAFYRHDNERRLKYLGELAKGEKKNVSFTLPLSVLSHYNVSLGKYIVEDGRFDLLIGASSQDIRLKKSIFVAGSAPYSMTGRSEPMIG